MIIAHNMQAMFAQRSLANNQGVLGKSLEKLSTGSRINRASDDAAGLAISEKMRAQISGLDQASRNSQDGIYMLQVAEGALDTTGQILRRMRTLAVQGANDTYTPNDRVEIDAEIKQLTDEIDRIANTTEYNGMALLNGSKEGIRDMVKGEITARVNTAADLKLSTLEATATIGANGANISASGTVVIYRTASNVLEIKSPDIASTVINVNAAASSVTVHGKTYVIEGLANMKVGDNIALNFQKYEAASNNIENGVFLQIGANSGQSISLGFSSMRANDLGVRGGANGVDPLTVTDHLSGTAAVFTIDQAISKVTAERAKFGAVQNRLEHTVHNLGTTAENLQAAESQIRDVDMAKEMMIFQKNSILAQSAQAMLAQANQLPQGVLNLLR